MIRYCFGIFLIFFYLQAAIGQQVYLKTGKLFDGKTASIQEKVTIVVEGAKILQSGPNIVIPANAEVIDLEESFVLPGLIDTHTHIILHEGNYEDQILRETPEFRALNAVPAARAMLMSGVTTIRDMGNEGAGFADIALRDAINKGLIPGPRILASIQPVTTTGSYNLLGFSPYISLPQIAYQGDGPDALQKRVRELVQFGADVIKIYVESFEKKQLRQDVLSGAINYTIDELKMIVEEARRSGLPVAAHVYSDQAAQMAIDAGVNSIEHGLYITEATFHRMAEKNIFYVPTLMVYHLWRDARILQPVSEARKKMLAATVILHTASFKTALRTPVKIAFGTDTFALPGTNSEELELMVEYGMSPIQALTSATGSAAKLLGMEDQIGAIAAGHTADIIAVRGNPAKNIKDIHDVVFVMKEGQVYHDAR